MKVAQIYCFIGYPGIFSTDTCLHVGAAFARCGRRVLLIDMKDNRGLRSQSISDWFPPVQAGIFDMLIGAEPEILHGDGASKWDILPDCGGDSDDDIALNMEFVLRAIERRKPSPDLLRNILADSIQQDYDDIMIDGGGLYSLLPFLEDMVLAADAKFIITLSAAQEIIAGDFRAFLEARPLAFRQERLQAVVFSEYEEDSAMQVQCVKTCMECLPSEMLAATIGKSGDIEESFQNHQDIFSYAPESWSAAEYAMLARKLLGNEKTMANDFLLRYEQIMRK